MRKSIFTTAIAALVLTSSTVVEAKKKKFTVPITDRFFEYVVPWEDGSKYVSKMDFVTFNNGIYFCGAGYSTGAVDQRFTNQLLSAAFFTVDGVKIIEDFRFFTYVRSKKKMATSKATCKLTRLKSDISKNADLEIGFTKLRFRE